VFSYFLGFALGGFAVAYFIKKRLVRKPLRSYALLELMVGASCICFSYVFHPVMAWLAPLQNLAESQGGKMIVRFGCGCVLVLPIAALMGASFPLIAQALDDRNSSGTRKWSVAYGANLSGAVLASLLAPYLILPMIGIRGAMWICFGICGSVAAIVFLRAESSESAELRQRHGQLSSAGGKEVWLLLGVAFLSGWIFFALEVVWTHLISAVIGGSVYSFSAMLASVLIGLLFGSSLASRGRTMRTSTLMQLCAIALLFQFWLWDIAPIMFVVAGHPIYGHFFTREAYRLLVALLLIVPSATFLGMIYPRLLASPIIRSKSDARVAGYLSAWNSLGCLLGAIMATFVLIPFIGSEWTLKVIVMVLAILAVVFRLRESDKGASPRLVSFLALAMIALALLPRHWEWKALTSGQAMYFGEARHDTAIGPSGNAAAATPSTSEIIFKDESIQGGFTTVVETTSGGRTVRRLLSNGKLQGDDDPTAELPTQFSVAAIPCLYAGHLDRALLIGFGTGHTAGILKELGIGKLDIAELSPGIIRGADEAFRSVNFGVLHDPTVTYALEDGRNLLLTHPDRLYDIITVEITSIWFAGATNVFSQEFFELAKQRLRPDGVLQQWVQLNRNSPKEISSVIATARAVFPYVSYHAYGNQGMLIAANRPVVENPQRNTLLESRFSRRFGADQAHKFVDGVTHSELLGQTGVDALIRATHPVLNTDHNHFIEYSTPARVSSERDWISYNIAFFREWNRRAMLLTDSRAPR
jgi:spermidine synthase